ncbi:hypothetical protein MEX01_48680 [Methylorubrum extorquens]|uniref:hypothetical protein n=1 Tax=Methylorubrum extorquens TaxID=408 RepID=UPI001168F5C9|nr:hypothetical protein [Methylorubrum extorquens]GEL44277.1 hypothetical protein MEX01_48680 [Methylorubrum extorquens]
MRSAAKSQPSVTVADAAEMLHARGVTPPMVEEDHHAIQHLVSVGIRAQAVPADLDAVRAALDARIATGLALIAEARVARRVAAE